VPRRQVIFFADVLLLIIIIMIMIRRSGYLEGNIVHLGFRSYAIFWTSFRCVATLATANAIVVKFCCKFRVRNA
jgi:hypothetical protein